MDGIRKCCANTIGKRISSSPTKSKTHRRYKPKMVSRRGGLCVKENDGVKIDIEDCCQMTLCETVSNIAFIFFFTYYYYHHH